MLRAELALAGFEDQDDLGEIAVLLASELCDNAVLHAGTEFDLAWQIADDEVTVAVSDRGVSLLEQHLAKPRQLDGRAATHGRGLLMVHRLATAWGTEHSSDGTNTVWFTVRR